jgi:hypothetical protein
MLYDYFLQNNGEPPLRTAAAPAPLRPHSLLGSSKVQRGNNK